MPKTPTPKLSWRPLAGLRDELYQEMLSHMKQTDVSVPYRDGDWWYYTRTEEGRQYAIHCRKRAAERCRATAT